MTAIASAVLAIMLYYSFLGKGGTPTIIYITAGFLTAMFAWQVQIIIRTFSLKEHFKKYKKPDPPQFETPTPKDVKTKELLDEADFNRSIPFNVSKNATKNLKEKVNR